MNYRFLGCWVAAGAAIGCFGQKITLDQYVVKNRTLLVGKSSFTYLEGPRLKAEGTSLAAFNRKVVTIGSMRAIVPTTMVKIDDSFSQKPDLYEGLDLRSKVIYLLATLSESQVKTATSKGLGFGDLNQQQQLVFQSIVPKKFEVQQLEPDGKRQKVTDSFRLTDQHRKGVRLKFTKTISFELPLENQRGYCMANTMDHVGIGDLPGLRRELSDMERGPNEIFGITVRSVVPNTQKPSNLDFHAKTWDFTVSFPRNIPLGQAITSLGQTGKVALFTDPRVARRPLTVEGEVRAGDLLASIAQMVTGTFRKVGPDYVLTSDLLGLGTRKTTFDQWEADIRQQQQEMSGEWLDKVRLTTLTKLVKTSPQDPYQPSDRMQEYLSKSFPGRRDPIPSDLIDDGIRHIVDRFNVEYSSQPVTTNGIVAESEVSFHFVLPTGEDLFEPGGGNIGTLEYFGESKRPKYTPPQMPPPRVLPEGSSVGIAIRAVNKDQVLKQIDQASSVGMKEVWIDTTSQEVLDAGLTAAKAKGVAVRLIIRPWQNQTGQEEVDQTILGDSGAALAKWAVKNPRLSNPRHTYDFMRSVLWPEMTISPNRRPDSWTTMASMTRTPGLSGVVLCDQQSAGYEPKVGEGYSIGNSPVDLVARQFGYSLSMRSSFLRANGVDPIDLVPPGLMSSVNVSPFFFPDMELMGYPRTYGSTEGDEFIIAPFVTKWQEFRMTEMKSGLASFKKAILDKIPVPIMGDLMAFATNKVVPKFIPLMPVNRDDPFTFDQSGPGAPFGANADKLVAVRQVIDDQTPENLQNTMATLGYMMKEPHGRTICIDITRLEAERADKFISQWFDPKNKS